MHRLLILEPEHFGGRQDGGNRRNEGWKNRRYKEKRRQKGRGREEQHGGKSVGVERETHLEKRKSEEEEEKAGNQRAKQGRWKETEREYLPTKLHMSLLVLLELVCLSSGLRRLGSM